MKKKIILFAVLFLIPFIKIHAIDISYQTHVQNVGWMDYVSNDELSGTTGQALRLEGIRIKLDNLDYDGGIEYQTHVQNVGWMDYVSNDELSGTTGRALRLEGIRIRLTGELANHYTIKYKVHVQNYGWMDYVSDGELAGTTGRALRLEGIRIKLISKDSLDANVTYTSHNSDGWQDYVGDGITGTTGISKTLNLFKVKLNNNTALSGNIKYQAYSGLKGWLPEVSSDEETGVNDYPIEAIKIRLTDELESKFNIFYRVHVSNIGWLDWTSNGELAGTTGYFYGIEAIEIKMQPKDDSNITTGVAYKEGKNEVNYSSHVQNIGWMNYVSDGQSSGTIGRGLRVESYKVKLKAVVSGDIVYNTYIARRGWSNDSKNDEMSGTTNLSRNIEAIKIRLEGNISNYYDVYYRTHNSYIGWLSWTKNGEISGSLNSNTQVEAIEIKLVLKNSKFTDDTSKPYVTGKWKDNKYYDALGRVATGFKMIDGVKYYFNSDGKMYGKDIMKVVDVSSWQQNINWDQVKRDDDVDAAIIRVGYGTTLNDDCVLDSQFVYNITNLQRIKMPYGIYIYGYAEYESSAVKEANFVLDNLKKYNVPKDTYIWYDAEEPISKEKYMKVIPKFIETIKNAGYKNVGVYASVSQLDTTNGRLNDSSIRSNPIWVAQYYKNLQYTGDYLGWQVQSDGIVNGISEIVDVSMFKK